MNWLKCSFDKYGVIYCNVLIMVLLINLTIIYTTMIPRTIHAEIDGRCEDIVTKAYTVEKALQQADIPLCDEDHLSEAAGAYVRDGMKLNLVHATNYTVTVDGKTREFKSLADTVGEALEEEGITVGEIDMVIPESSARLKDDMNVVIKRVVVKEKAVSETVDYKTVVKKDGSMVEGTEKVKREGKAGKDKVTYSITYVDGKETKRKEIKRETVEKAENRVVYKGTAVEYNGKLYSRKLTVKAYSYTGGGRTASGTRARVGEIAVDPRVIKLGTVVYIPGIGERRAEDTGGNIKGNTIDIYMSSKSACRKWGCRTITIYIK
ncbi:MAG: G5 domain-containing protein [Bacillota bacterium]|nr:G5 domain-containing protein [Bacillota bacterium]